MEVEKLRKELEIDKSWLAKRLRGDKRKYERDIPYEKDEKIILEVLELLDFNIKSVKKRYNL